MQINHKEYQNKVFNLLKPEIKNGPAYERILYLTLKLNSEMGELCGELCKREFHGKNISNVNLCLECGDVYWYLYNLAYEDARKNNGNHRDKIFELIDSANNMSDYNIAGYNIMEWSDTIMKVCCQIRDAKNYGINYSRLHEFAYKFTILVKLLGFSVQEVLDRNIEKLEDRHGKEYNKDFYNNNKSSDKRFNLSEL